MKRLVNLSASPWLQGWFPRGGEDLDQFMDEHKLDGIEWLVYDQHQPFEHKGVRGWHLRYWPYWLDLWFENWDGLNKNGFTIERCQQLYGGTTKTCLIEWYQNEFQKAEAYGAEYMVLHACHVDLHEVYVGNYSYTDEQVIDATIELVNAAFCDTGNATLLFENLWWPGLRFDNPQLIEKLMTDVKYQNKGFILDLSHMALSSGKIRVTDDLVAEVRRVMVALGEWKDRIYALHCSYPFHDSKFQDFQRECKRLEKSDNQPFWMEQERIVDVDKQFSHILEVIHELDTHRPLMESYLEELLDIVEPKWIVHELLPKNLMELRKWLREIVNQEEIL